MFGISMWEVGVILVVALIILGPRQLVEAARVAGKVYREIQRLAWEVRDHVNLDSVTSSVENRHVPAKPTSTETEAFKDVELPPPPVAGSGPDFYADLLEQAAQQEADEREGMEQDGDGAQAGEDKEAAENKEDRGDEKPVDDGRSEEGSTR